MSSPDYHGTLQRTFQSAVLHLLETGYGVLGSQRVLGLLAADVQELVEHFYPPPEHIASGWMLFTGTRASGAKARPGQPAAEFELVTLAWPVLLPEDVQCLACLPGGQAGREGHAALLRQRLTRIVEYGQQQPAGPVLLTQADLAAMVNLSSRHVGELLTQARRLTGKPLLTKGYYFDQGRHPTHKAETIALYEAGLDEVAIARQLGHAQESIGQYIRDYERVKLLLSHRTPLESISLLIDMQPSIARAYVSLVAQYHPELVPEGMSPPQT